MTKTRKAALESRMGPDPTGPAEGTVNENAARRFESIESSHDYVALLLQVVDETAAAVGEDVLRLGDARSARRREAFQLVAYKLEQLRFHLESSRRRLNELRMLRGMLHGEGSTGVIAA